MTFNPKALLVFFGFGLLVMLALSSGRGAWFWVAELLTAVVILLGVAGFLRGRRVGHSSH